MQKWVEKIFDGLLIELLTSILFFVIQDNVLRITALGIGTLLAGIVVLLPQNNRINEQKGLKIILISLMAIMSAILLFSFKNDSKNDSVSGKLLFNSAVISDDFAQFKTVITNNSERKKWISFLLTIQFENGITCTNFFPSAPIVLPPQTTSVEDISLDIPFDCITSTDDSASLPHNNSAIIVKECKVAVLNSYNKYLFFLDSEKYFIDGDYVLIPCEK